MQCLMDIVEDRHDAVLHLDYRLFQSAGALETYPATCRQFRLAFRAPADLQYAVAYHPFFFQAHDGILPDQLEILRFDIDFNLDAPLFIQGQATQLADLESAEFDRHA